MTLKITAADDFQKHCGKKKVNDMELLHSKLYHVNYNDILSPLTHCMVRINTKVLERTCVLPSNK